MIGKSLLGFGFLLILLLLPSCNSSISGVGCKTEGRHYISEDLDRCARIKFKCDSFSRPFSDECGCGCEKVRERQVKNFSPCSQRARGADYCVQVYEPVCGWKREPSGCFSPICKSSFANSCFACADREVVGYTKGACPN